MEHLFFLLLSRCMFLRFFVSHFPHSSLSQCIFYCLLNVFTEVTSASWAGSDVPFNRSTGASWDCLCPTQQHLHSRDLSTVTQYTYVCIEHKQRTVSQKSKETEELTFAMFCIIYSKQSGAMNLCLKRLVFSEVISFTRKHKLGG